MNLVDLFSKKIKPKQISSDEREEYVMSIQKGYSLSRKSLELLKNFERTDCIINKLRNPTKDNLSSVLVTLEINDTEDNREYFKNIGNEMKKKYG
jgi:hypothetical protein